MNITKATYGGVDCLSQVLQKVKDNKLIIRSSNDIIGDVSPGIVKTLSLTIELENGEQEIIHTKEGDLLVYPPTKNDRLGIFYSNNNNPSIYPAIVASLNSIKKASEDKIDILTCMWNHEPENPFAEYIAWTKSGSHLNQLLQIMQLLYAARQIHNYEYVSFLEHDVLYPKGYFDYPDFPEGTVITNMNYGGVNSNGWQTRNQDDEPFHQMTMRFDDAIKHCESILPNALVTNSGMIETQTMNRMQWNCQNEAIHINHGHHFTSHNSIYSKTKVYKDHDYWGSHEDYLYLFK
jgi:hypothetical protein